jgi:hypothetical protein
MSTLVVAAIAVIVFFVVSWPIFDAARISLPLDVASLATGMR